MTEKNSPGLMGVSLRYKWCEASMPPPHYFEYTIGISAESGGEIVFYPDYPTHDSPMWTRVFEVKDESLEELYKLMIEREIFRGSWTEIENAPVGGSLEWLEVTVRGERIKVPAEIEESEMVEEVYRVIKSLVPDSIWVELKSLREQYERDYLENRS